MLKGNLENKSSAISENEERGDQSDSTLAMAMALCLLA